MINNTLKGYIMSLIGDIPYWVYVMLLLFSLFFTLWIKFNNGIIKGRYYIFRFMLIEYLFLLVCSTIIFRETMLDYNYKLHPFWSYFDYENGERISHSEEIIMNIAVFIPVGILGALSNKYKKSFVRVVGLGFLLSFFVESFQLVLKKGVSEVDDIIHNTLGCFLGFLICVSVIKVMEYWMKKI